MLFFDSFYFFHNHQGKEKLHPVGDNKGHNGDEGGGDYSLGGKGTEIEIAIP